MGRVKTVLNIELAFGLFCFAIALAVYIYLWKNDFREALRNRYRTGAVLSALLLIGQGVCWYSKGFRLWTYNFLVGIELPKESTTLVTILGAPFDKAGTDILLTEDGL